jgi:predicted PurR-regulated permease PerM
MDSTGTPDDLDFDGNLDGVPDGRRVDVAGLVTRIGVTTWSLLGLLLLLYAGLWIAVQLEVLLGPVVLAVAIIYVLNPLVHRIAGWGAPRWLAVLGSFLALVGAIVLLGFLVIPSISSQASELASDFPNIFDDSAVEMENTLADLGFTVDLWDYDQLETFFSDPENQDALLSAITDRLGAVTSGIFEAILVFFVAPVIAFYILLDLPRIADDSSSLVPPRARDEVVYVTRNVGSAVGGFLRGQVLVALIVGILTSVGFLIIGLEFWLIIGMIAGVLNIVPFVGPWVGGGLGFMVGLVTDSPTTAILAAVVAFIVQQIDNNFVSPQVLRATVHLHPAVVILVLILGGAVAGLWGVLLAVPVTAGVKIVVGHLWRTRVLGQTWMEAAEAMIRPHARPEALDRIRDRLGADDEDEEPAANTGQGAERPPADTD